MRRLPSSIGEATLLMGAEHHLLTFAADAHATRNEHYLVAM